MTSDDHGLRVKAGRTAIVALTGAVEPRHVSGLQCGALVVCVEDQRALQNKGKFDTVKDLWAEDFIALTLVKFGKTGDHLAVGDERVHALRDERWRRV